jgi:hypothetical protein
MGRSDSDVFVPEFRVGLNELGHQSDAGRVLQNFDLNAAQAQVILGSQEGFVLTGNHARDLIEHDRAAAHGAGGKSRIQRAVTIYARREAAGVAQTIHFAVIDGAAGLHAAVMAAANDAAFVYQYRADGNTAFGKALPGLFDGRF